MIIRMEEDRDTNSFTVVVLDTPGDVLDTIEVHPQSGFDAIRARPAVQGGYNVPPSDQEIPAP